MTEISRPWSGTSTGDAGPYSDNQWANTWMRSMGFGASSANRGVVRNVDDELRVTAQSPASNAVDVNTGAALVQGKWYQSDAVESFTISANGSGNPRIDTIVLRADYTAQTVRLALKTGTPAATPAAPTLTQTIGVTWEIPLADINVANGFTTITQPVIINRQDWANVPNQISFEVVSAEATDLVPGIPVKFNSSGLIVNGGNMATLSGYYGYYQSLAYAGVLAERVSNGGRARVVVQGLAYVLLEDTVNAAELIGPGLNGSFTSRNSTAFSTPVVIWGMALEAGVSGDRILAYLDIPNASPLYACVLQDTAFSVPNTGSAAVAFTGAELFDPVGMHSLVTNTSRINIPITGLYAIEANVVYAASVAHSAAPLVCIRIDGTTFEACQTSMIGTYQPTLSAAIKITLNIGQYVELVVSQTSGAARTARITLSVARVESQ